MGAEHDAVDVVLDALGGADALGNERVHRPGDQLAVRPLQGGVVADAERELAGAEAGVRGEQPTQPRVLDLGAEEDPSDGDAHRPPPGYSHRHNPVRLLLEHLHRPSGGGDLRHDLGGVAARRDHGHPLPGDVMAEPVVATDHLAAEVLDHHDATGSWVISSVHDCGLPSSRAGTRLVTFTIGSARNRW